MVGAAGGDAAHHLHPDCGGHAETGAGRWGVCERAGHVHPATSQRNPHRQACRSEPSTCPHNLNPPSSPTFTCSSSLLVHPYLPVLSSPSLVTHHALSLCILPCPAFLPSLLTHLYLLIPPPCTCLSSLHPPCAPTFTCSSSLLAHPFLPIHSSPTLLAHPHSLCILLSRPLFTIPCNHPCSLLAHQSLPVLSSLAPHPSLLAHPPALYILTCLSSLHPPSSLTLTCSSSRLTHPNFPCLSSPSPVTHIYLFILHPYTS